MRLPTADIGREVPALQLQLVSTASLIPMACRLLPKQIVGSTIVLWPTEGSGCRMSMSYRGLAASVVGMSCAH